MCRNCLSEEEANKVELVQDIGSDFSDGAFLALCEEQDVPVENLALYYEKHEKPVEKKKNA